MVDFSEGCINIGRKSSSDEMKQRKLRERPKNESKKSIVLVVIQNNPPADSYL